MYIKKINRIISQWFRVRGYLSIKIKKPIISFNFDKIKLIHIIKIYARNIGCIIRKYCFYNN